MTKIHRSPVNYGTPGRAVVPASCVDFATNVIKLGAVANTAGSIAENYLGNEGVVL